MCRIATMRAGLGAAALAVALGSSAAALADPDAPAPSAADQKRSEKAIELQGVEDTIRASDEQRRGIESEIESIRADRARLSAALIETDRKGAEHGTRRLRGRRQAGEPQRQGRRARGFAGKSPGSDRGSAGRAPAHGRQSAAGNSRQARATWRRRCARRRCSGSAIPALKSEAEALGRDIEALAKTREAIARERDALAQAGAALASERARLSMLIEARQASLASAQDALGSQQQRAADSRQTGDVAQGFDFPARRRGRRAQGGGGLRRTRLTLRRRGRSQRKRRSRAGPPQRGLKPEIAFVDAKGRVPLPAAGVILKTFGSPDGLGGQERGVLVATLAGATVSAPADGSVLVFRALSELWATFNYQCWRQGIISCLREWSELAYCPASSFSRENPSAPWATGRSGWRPPPQLALLNPFSISNCARTARRSIRGRGGRSQTSKRRADELENELSGAWASLWARLRPSRRRKRCFLSAPPLMPRPPTPIDSSICSATCSTRSATSTSKSRTRAS